MPSLPSLLSARVEAVAGIDPELRPATKPQFGHFQSNVALRLAKAEGKPREDFVVTMDRSDEKTAFVKVKCQLPPRYFTDYLVALKLADGWKIVSKSYRYDLRE